VPKTVCAKHVKPARSIATDVNIDPGYKFSFVKRIEVNVRPSARLIISSHKLWLAISLLIWLFSARASATSIVVFVGSDQIIIAADGVLTAISNGHATQLPFCKIRKSREVSFAVSGDYGVPGTNLDVFEMARKAVEKSKTLPEVYESVRSLVMPHLKTIADRNKVADPVRYSKLLKGDPVIEMAFAKFEGNAPLALGVTFYIDHKGRPIDPPIRNIMGPGTDNAPAIARLGLHDGIEVALRSPQWSEMFRADVVDALRYLIQLEIDRATAEKRFDVGPPIAIMRITKTKAGFVDGFAGECPNTPHNRQPKQTLRPPNKPRERPMIPMIVWIPKLVFLAGIFGIVHRRTKGQR